MSKSRKVLCALLAVMMVFSVFSISAFAANELWEAEDATWTQEWSLGNPTPTDVANQYTVDIILSTNYNVGPVSFKLTGVTSIDAVAVGAGYYSGAQTDKVNTGANLGLVFMFPLTPPGTTVGAKSCDSAVIATVTYTTSAANGAVTIANDPKNADNPNGTLTATRCTTGKINDSQFVAGQKVTVNNPGGGGNSDIAVKPGVTGVVIDTNKKFGSTDYAGVIMGIPAKGNGATNLTSGDYYKDFVTATNGGYIKVVKSIYSGRAALWGTGTKIEVYNSNDTLAKTYIIVLFGDINGDSVITNIDIGNALEESATPKRVGADKMAANCFAPSRGSAAAIASGLYEVNNSDIGLILEQSANYNAIDFANIAAKHAQYNTYYQ